MEIRTISHFKEQFEEMWKRNHDELGLKAKRINIDKLLHDQEKKVLAEAQKLIPLWLVLADEAIHVLYHLELLLGGFTGRESGALLMLTSRMVGLAVGIRKLAVMGLEDAARPLLRSFVETLDMAIAALGHAEFIDAMMSDDLDEHQFWKKYIAYGHVYEYMKASLINLGFEEEVIQELLSASRETKSILSGSVHSALSSLFRSTFVPSLAHLGLLARTSLGHISVHSPGLLSLLIAETQRYGSIFVQAVINRRAPAFLTETQSDERMQSALVAYMAFQELVSIYGKDLPPPFPFPEDEDAEDPV